MNWLHRYKGRLWDCKFPAAGVVLNTSGDVLGLVQSRKIQGFSVAEIYLRQDHQWPTWLLFYFYFFFSALTVIVHVLSRSQFFCDLVDYNLLGSSVHGIFQANFPGVGCPFLLQQALSGNVDLSLKLSLVCSRKS